MRIINCIILSLIFIGISGYGAEVANSINDFSLDGTQGENGWVSGYRNYTQDGGGDDYDPNEDFIAFDANDHWRGEGWRLVPSNAPWTTLNLEFGHPNGPNNGDEQWAIRRWESDRSGPLAFTWNLREQNDGGTGVGGSLHHNGVLVDSAATNDTNGLTRTYFLNIESGDVVDLALTPVGTGGDRSDGADGSFFSLVIDDDDNAQDMMRKFLEKQNVSILQAKSGEDGLKLAAEHMPDAITLDVMMPEMDGWEVLTALQSNETTKNIPVIMLTMADEPDIGFSLGATDYLTKPVNWDQLSGILNRHKIESDSQSILIVEDDETTREMLKKSLASNDFKVRIAKNGKEGLDKVKESKPGLVLLDLMMPEMDGFEFAEKLRENKDWLDIPVVVITAKDLTSEDHNRLKGNVEAIMQKGSYSKKQLLSEVGERIKQLKERS